MIKPREGLLAAIEAGGTKFICGVADHDGNMIDEIRIPTTTPEETLGASRDFFRRVIDAHGPLATMAIGSFGPLSLNTAAEDYGAITSTPKPGWSNTDLVGYFSDAFDIPIVLDTDVNASAVGELLFGSGRGLDCFCYVTIGTGIGVGVMIRGEPHGGANHPEAGHIRLPRAPGDEDFAGICPFHGDCLEGMACGPAMMKRWDVRPPELSDDHPAWAIEADYIAGLCQHLTYIVRPDRIILGGGVMQKPHLYTLIREALVKKLGGYDTSCGRLDMDDYIVAPTAGASAGLIGALASAYRLSVNQWPAHWRIGALAPEESHSHA